MPVKIRLSRHGKKKAPFYHIIIADGRSPRDGKFIESIGIYNPKTIPATIEINAERALDWLSKGAQPTDTARRILSFKGILFKKHLDRGIKMGKLVPELAEQKWKEWETKHAAKVAEATSRGTAGLKKKNRKEEPKKG